jgi:hypothetical protein
MPKFPSKHLTNGILLAIIWTIGNVGTGAMIIKTRVFELATGKYNNLSDLAKAMDLSVSQVYRVREGKRGINEKFLIGAKKAFPDYRLDELFYFNSGPSSGQMVGPTVTDRYNHIVQRFTALDF